MNSFDKLRKSFEKAGMAFDEAIDAFNALGSCCVHYIGIDLARAICSNHSNNWLKMHGLPMRRKTRKNRMLLWKG